MSSVDADFRALRPGRHSPNSEYGIAPGLVTSEPSGPSVVFLPCPVRRAQTLLLALLGMSAQTSHPGREKHLPAIFFRLLHQE